MTGYDKEVTVGKAVVVRYETRTAEAAEENQRLVEKVFRELRDEHPEDLRYAAFRLADGVSFVHVAVIDRDDDPLAKLSAFAEFQQTIGERVAGPPTFDHGTMIASYGFES